MSYDVGDALIIETTIYSADETPVDPATVVFEWRWGSDMSTTTWTYGIDSQIVRTGVGVYETTIVLDRPGVLYYGWRTENPTSAAQTRLRVRPWLPRP